MEETKSSKEGVKGERKSKKVQVYWPFCNHKLYNIRQYYSQGIIKKSLITNLASREVLKDSPNRNCHSTLAAI